MICAGDALAVLEDHQPARVGDHALRQRHAAAHRPNGVGQVRLRLQTERHAFGGKPMGGDASVGLRKAKLGRFGCGLARRRSRDCLDDV